MFTSPSDQRLHQELCEERAKFILAELDIAMTFIDISKTTHNPETALRNRENAMKAIQAVEKMLLDTVIEVSEKDRPYIEERLEALREALAAGGAR